MVATHPNLPTTFSLILLVPSSKCGIFLGVLQGVLCVCLAYFSSNKNYSFSPLQSPFGLILGSEPRSTLIRKLI